MSEARNTKDRGDRNRAQRLAPVPTNGNGRAVVTLSPAAAAAARRLGASMGDVSLPEVVRRGLILLDLIAGLPEDEEIVIRHKDTNELERIRFAWETFRP